MSIFAPEAILGNPTAPGRSDARLRSPEVARRLGIGADGVYRLIFDGDLGGRPDRYGIVDVSEGSVAAYLDAHSMVERSKPLNRTIVLH